MGARGSPYFLSKNFMRAEATATHCVNSYLGEHRDRPLFINIFHQRTVQFSPCNAFRKTIGKVASNRCRATSPSITFPYREHAC